MSSVYVLLYMFGVVCRIMFYWEYILFIFICCDRFVGLFDEFVFIEG